MYVNGLLGQAASEYIDYQSDKNILIPSAKKETAEFAEEIFLQLFSSVPSTLIRKRTWTNRRSRRPFERGGGSAGTIIRSACSGGPRRSSELGDKRLPRFELQFRLSTASKTNQKPGPRSPMLVCGRLRIDSSNGPG